MAVKNPGISKGISFGILSIILGIGLYFINPALFIFFRMIVVFILSFYFLYQAAITARHTLGGFISVKETFIPCFSTWLIGTLISTLFAYVFLNYIAPETADQVLEYAIEKIEQAEGQLSEEQIEEARTAIEEEGIQTGIGVLLNTWIIGLFVGAFVSFVISLIVKREDDGLNN